MGGYGLCMWAVAAIRSGGPVGAVSSCQSNAVRPIDKPSWGRVVLSIMTPRYQAESASSPSALLLSIRLLRTHSVPIYSNRPGEWGRKKSSQTYRWKYIERECLRPDMG